MASASPSGRPRGPLSILRGPAGAARGRRRRRPPGRRVAACEPAAAKGSTKPALADEAPGPGIVRPGVGSNGTQPTLGEVHLDPGVGVVPRDDERPVLGLLAGREPDRHPGRDAVEPEEQRPWRRRSAGSTRSFVLKEERRVGRAEVRCAAARGSRRSANAGTPLSSGRSRKDRSLSPTMLLVQPIQAEPLPMCRDCRSSRARHADSGASVPEVRQCAGTAATCT